MSSTKRRLGTIIVLVVAGVAVAVRLHHRALQKLSEENFSLREQAAQLAGVAEQAQDWSNRLVQASAAQPLASDPSAELLKLRGRVGVLQRQLEELRQWTNVQALAERAGSPSQGAGLSAEAIRRMSLLRMEGRAEYARQKTLLEKLQTLAEDRETLVQSILQSGVVEDPHLKDLVAQRDSAAATLRLQPGQGPEADKASLLMDDLNVKIDNQAHGILLGLQAKVESTKKYLEALQQAEVNPVVQVAPSVPEAPEPPLERTPLVIVPVIKPASPQAIDRAREALEQQMRVLPPEPVGL
jgi:hypothetical protein